MLSRIGGLLLLSTLAVPAPVPSWSSPPEWPQGTVPLPTSSVFRSAAGLQTQALELRAGWKRFGTRYGGWRASWNLDTGSPHRALGPPIALAGYRDDAGSVDRAVRAFIARESGVFGTPTLETVMCQRLGEVWVVRYRQLIRDIPVILDAWDFRVNSRGELMVFGADARRESQDVPTRPLVVWSVAKEAAHLGVPYDHARDRVEGGQLVLVPDTRATSGLRLAYQASVVTAQWRERWNALVDASNGELLWRESGMRRVVSGTVSGTIHPVGPSDPLETRPFPHQQVSVGSNSALTDLAGQYSATASGTVTVSAGLSGPYALISRNDGQPNASFTQMTTDPSTVNISWSDANSHVAERTAFYNVQRAHDFLKSIEPTYTGADHPIQVLVNDTDPCQGSSGFGFIFLPVAGNGCPNMATLLDVLAHEYGHFADEAIYTDAGVLTQNLPYGDLALIEGLADVYAAYLRGSPLIAQGFYGPGTLVRDLTTGKRWPADESGYVYHTAMIYSGALWDVREALGASTAQSLWHFAKRAGAGANTNVLTAMKDFFLEVLVQDDDDGNLTNGTPHLAAINAAFDAHGIGTGVDIAVSHMALTDKAAAGSFPVSATVIDGGVLGTLQSVTLYVSVNGGSYAAQPMTPGTDSKFTSAITVSGPGIVRYYIRAQDTMGGTQTTPLSAPRDNAHVFLVGPTTTSIAHDMETDQGWTAGAAGDDATSGLWVRANPVGTTLPGANFIGGSGTVYQTRADHTPGGPQLCFVTGNGSPSDQDFTLQTVQFGKTTLTSPVFSAVGIGGEPAIEYWRWYSNFAGLDSWQVSISNDGGATWVPVELTHHHQAFWRRIAFLIRDYVTPTSTMRLRFIAEQRLRRRTYAEGALDDFRLFAIPGASAAQTASLSASMPNLKLAMTPVTSVPFRGAVTLRYVLPHRGEMRAAIYDATGRKVKDLQRATQAAGEHALTWDGRDQNGKDAGSGIYFARLITNDGNVVCRLVRVRG